MLSVCVTVKNRAQNLRVALGSLATALPAGSEIIITDWMSTDESIPEIVNSIWRPGLSVGVHFIKDPAFSRGKGLNVAAELAILDTLLFTDADITFTPAAMARGLRTVGDGGAWFPICSTTDKYGKSRWRVNGKGVAMLSKNMFNAAGRWDEFTTWGMEDRNFHANVSQKFKVLREQDSGVRHLYHPTSIPKYNATTGARNANK